MDRKKVVHETYVVPVKGILTPVEEDKLTLADIDYLAKKLFAEVNKYPRAVRGLLAQAIMQQNGVKVFPGGIIPKIGKKEKNKMRFVTVKDPKPTKNEDKGHVL